MEKHRISLSKKNIFTLSTVILTVLIVVLSVNFAKNGKTSGDGKSPDVKEIERLYESEMSQIRDRDSAYEDAFVASGGDPDDYEPMDGGVDIDILYASGEILSVVIITDSEDASIFGREKYYNINRETGYHLNLGDVFGYDFKETVLAELMPQIEADGDVYEGIDVAPLISEDRMFYLADGGNTAVIVFDRGEIAPDTAGMKKYPVHIVR